MRSTIKTGIILTFLTCTSNLLYAQKFGINCNVKIIIEEKSTMKLGPPTTKYTPKNRDFSFYIRKGETTESREISLNQYSLKIRVNVEDNIDGRGIELTGYKDSKSIGSSLFVSRSDVKYLSVDGDFGSEFEYKCKCKIERVKEDD